MPRIGSTRSLMTPGYSEPFEEAHGLPLAPSGTTDADDPMWNRLGRSPTSIPEFKRQQAVFVSRYLYQLNPFAQRLVELLRDFVIGQTGFEVHADDERVQKVIDRFWFNRHNKWQQDWIARYELALSVDGEVALPVQVAKNNPEVLVGYISTLSVQEVRPLSFRPGSAKELVVKPIASSGDPLTFPVLGRQSIDEIRGMSKGLGSKPDTIGTFFWSVNSLPDDPRGLPDLFTISDDLDQLSKALWARARKAELEGSYIWDVTIDGATQPVLDKFERDLILKPPRSGSFRAHNDRVHWNTVQPPGGGTDATNELRMLRSNLSSAFGIPDFFLTGESGAGRMATTELWSTLVATAGSRQREMKLFVGEMIDFVIDWSISIGELDEEVKRTFHVNAPVIGIRDLQRMGGMLSNLGEFFSSMQASGVLTPEDTQMAMRTLLRNLGFDISSEFVKPELILPPTPPAVLPTTTTNGQRPVAKGQQPTKPVAKSASKQQSNGKKA